MEIVTENEIKEQEWKNFLDIHNSASLYHTPEWKKFLEKTFNYDPYYYFTKDECGRIVGLLPLFYIKSKLTGNRLCAVPFSHICGIIYDESYGDHILKEMVNKGIDLYKQLKADKLEIRDHINLDKFQKQNSFSTHILELSPNVEEIWSRIENTCRRAIRRSRDRGLSIDVSKNIEDFKEFYELNCMTKKEIGVPCHPWKFFKNLLDIMKDNVCLYAVKFNNEIIAGGIAEYYKDHALAGYGAADSNYLISYPYNAFIWKQIEDACKNGYKYYDLGRTSNNNLGLMSFKKRFGTIEKKIYYSYYPHNQDSLTENRDSFKYKIATKIIPNIPMKLYKTFSDITFGNFG